MGDTQLKAANAEISALQKQMQIERETHKKELQDVNAQVHIKELDKVETVEKLRKKADEERKFLESEIHRINVEMNEAKASSRESRKLVQQANQELSLMNDEREELKKDCENINEKFNIARSSLEAKVTEVLQGGERTRQLESDLLDAKDRIRRQEQEIESANSGLCCDIGDIEQIVGCSVPNDTNVEPVSWVASLRRKLKHLKLSLSSKFEENSKKLQQANQERQEIQSLYRSLDEDRRVLLSEVTQQNHLVDTLSREKTSLLIENKEARFVIQDMEDKVSNLTSDLEHESRKERQRIVERYRRYKNTMTSLRADIEDSRRSILKESPSRLNRSPSPIRRVTIADTPTKHGYEPSKPQDSSSPKPTSE